MGRVFVFFLVVLAFCAGMEEAEQDKGSGQLVPYASCRLSMPSTWHVNEFPPEGVASPRREVRNHLSIAAITAAFLVSKKCDRCYAHAIC